MPADQSRRRDVIQGMVENLSFLERDWITIHSWRKIVILLSLLVLYFWAMILGYLIGGLVEDVTCRV